MATLREEASDEVIEKFNELTDTLKIRVMNNILDKEFTNLTYLDSTLLRDVLDLDLNCLVMYFSNNSIKNKSYAKNIG
jgi:hypothetical protein